MIEIASSIMCANLLRLGEDISELDAAGIDYLHIDVMDGHFVPNIGLNLDVVEQIRKVTSTPIDIHLMVTNPEDYLSRLNASGVQRISVHIEATAMPLRFLARARSNGVKIGIALNPATPVSAVHHVLGYLDYVLVMTVEPGFAGQSFIPQMVEKVGSVRRALQRAGVNVPIQVDGNITVATARMCIEQGASMLVAGSSSLFRQGSSLYQAALEFKRLLGSDPSSIHLDRRSSL